MCRLSGCCENIGLDQILPLLAECGWGKAQRRTAGKWLNLGFYLKHVVGIHIHLDLHTTYPLWEGGEGG